MKLFLDDYRQPEELNAISQYKDPIYADNDDWVVVKSYDEFVKTIEEQGVPELVSFDHDLADMHYGITTFDYNTIEEKTGYHCAKWLIDYCIEKKIPYPKYEVHSFNVVGSKNIEMLIQNFIKNGPL